MPLERRNEPQMLRQFSKMYPSYNLNPLRPSTNGSPIGASARTARPTRTSWAA